MSAQTDYQPELDWAFVRKRLRDGNRSAEAEAAALWAVDSLERTFGWPQAWRGGGAPPEIVTCFSHIVGLIGTIELALTLHELRDVPGTARIRDAIRGSRRPDQLASPRTQLKVAALAHAQGLEVRLEPKQARVPADLRIGKQMSVEVLALVRDEATRNVDRWLSELTVTTRALGVKHGVRFDGEVREPLDEAETAQLVERLETAARVAASGLAVPPIRVGGATVFVSAAAAEAGGSSFKLPGVDHAHRLARRLRAKADQTARSGATWIFGEILSEMWRLTPWSRLPLEQKAQLLAVVVRGTLGDASHLRGAVLSDGAASLRPGETGGTEWAGIGVRALKLRLDPFRIRETITIGLTADPADDLAVWQGLLRSEPQWLAGALGRVGLALPPELS